MTFLEFDFPDIDDVIPFGPMSFWGAWYVDLDHYGYDVKEFWMMKRINGRRRRQ